MAQEPLKDDSAGHRNPRSVPLVLMTRLFGVLVCPPSDNVLHELVLKQNGSGFKPANDPFMGKVNWNLRQAAKTE